MSRQLPHFIRLTGDFFVQPKHIVSVSCSDNIKTRSPKDKAQWYAIVTYTHWRAGNKDNGWDRVSFNSGRDRDYWLLEKLGINASKD